MGNSPPHPCHLSRAHDRARDKHGMGALGLAQGGEKGFRVELSGLQLLI